MYIISNQYLKLYLTTTGVVFLDGDNAMAILCTLLEPYEKFIVIQWTKYPHFISNY
jgi:hypothetical protein